MGNHYLWMAVRSEEIEFKSSHHLLTGYVTLGKFFNLFETVSSSGKWHNNNATLQFVYWLNEILHINCLGTVPAAQ